MREIADIIWKIVRLIVLTAVILGCVLVSVLSLLAFFYAVKHICEFGFTNNKDVILFCVSYIAFSVPFAFLLLARELIKTKRI